MLVVDAADEERAGDQFPGVAVVREARAGGAEGRPTIVVVTGHYLHDGLRHRMAGAGADLYFMRSDLRSPEALIDVVVHPDRYRRGVPPLADAREPGVLGLDAHSDVEAFVDWVEDQGVGQELAGRTGRGAPRSRRWERLRREASRAGGVEARNLTTGQVPQGQDVPSVRQLRRLWEWAARITRPDR